MSQPAGSALRVTSYRKEAVQQQVASQLTTQLESAESTLSCFEMSGQGHFLVGDSKGNLYIGQRVNRIVEFQALTVFNYKIYAVLSHGSNIYVLGRESKEVKENENNFLLLKQVIIAPNKKPTTKQIMQIQPISGDPTFSKLSNDGSLLLIGDTQSNYCCIRIGKTKILTQGQLKVGSSLAQILYIAFYQLNDQSCLAPYSELTSKSNSQVRVFSVVGQGGEGAEKESQILLIAVNFNSGESQILEIKNIFSLSPMVQSCITVADNRLCYAHTQQIKADESQSNFEQILVDEKQQQQIINVNDLRNIQVIMKMPILSKVLGKSGQIQRLMCLKSQEFLIQTDNQLLIVQLSEGRQQKAARILYQASDLNQNYMFSYDSNRQAYLLLSTNPSSLQFLELVQIEAEQLIDQLLIARQFTEALKLVQDPRSRCQEYKIASVKQQYAQYLFENSQFDEAVKLYIQTIGILEASVVVRAFLEYGRTAELTKYLEALHAQKQAAVAHTNLLLNCYVKEKNIQQMQVFLESAEQRYFETGELLFDVGAAARNCLQAGLRSVAVEMAAVLGEEVYAFQLLVQDGSYQEALLLIKGLTAEQVKECLQKYGNLIIEKGDEKQILIVKELVKQLCTEYKCTRFELIYREFSAQIRYGNALLKRKQQLTPEYSIAKINDFLHLFVKQEHELYLVEILTELVKDYLQQEPGQVVDKEILFRQPSVPVLAAAESKYKVALDGPAIETYFELLLKQMSYVNKGLPFLSSVNRDFIVKMFADLSRRHDKLNFSYDHLLILFQTYDLKTCVIQILLKLEMHPECLKFYALNGQFAEALSLYQTLPVPIKLQLYTDLLQLAVESGTESNVADVLAALQADKATQISPLAVVELLTKLNPALPLSSVYEFLREKLNEIQESTKTSYQQFAQTQLAIETCQKKYRELQQPKEYLRQSCAKCGIAVDPPCVYVRCGHVYHEKCWRAVGKCNCWQAVEEQHAPDFEVEGFSSFADVLSCLGGQAVGK